MTKLPPRSRKVRILATLGPASDSAEMIRALFIAGADAFRINMSHGAHEDHAARIAIIRELENEFHRPTTILGDLQGPKLRVGTFEKGLAILEKGAPFILDRDETPGDARRVNLPHPEIYAALVPGDVLLTNHVKAAVRQARDAGVLVVGLPTAYINNSGTPPGKVHPNENGWVLEDVSSLILETHIPWDQGIVRIPQVPEMPVFPSPPISPARSTGC